MHGTARRGAGTPRRDIARGRRIGPPVSRRGISLIETLVAFAILAVAMTVLAQLMSWAMHESVFSRRRAQATLLAQERMEDLLAHRADLAAWEAATKKDFVFDRKTEKYCFDEPGHPHPELAHLPMDVADRGYEGPSRPEEDQRADYWLRSGVEGAGGKRELWTTLVVPAKSPATAAAEPNRLEGVPQ